MRIVSLRAENLKRLKVVDITPSSDLVRITGRNESGKSSVLDAIAWALLGKRAATSKPVRDGEQRATVQLNLGEVTVIRRFAADGATAVIVEAPNGARFPSPQRFLDELIGELSFDPLAFARANAKEQLETLRNLVKLDVDVDALDGMNARDKALRTDWNRRIVSFTERVKVAAEQVDPSMDVSPVDVSGLVDQMQNAAEHNQRVRLENTRRADSRLEAQQAKGEAADCRREAEELLHRADVAERKAQSIEASLALLDEKEPVPALIQTAELRQQIADAERNSADRARQRQSRDQHAAAVRELEEAETQAAALTEAMDARTEQKRAAIANAKWPIDGLSFGDGMVLYNGLPFEQASSAQQLRVSVALAMAANPKLRVLRIKDGSLLDETSLAAIAEMAAEQDYQVWLEEVRQDASIGIHMCDGSVDAIDGQPVDSSDPQALNAATASGTADEWQGDLLAGSPVL